MWTIHITQRNPTPTLSKQSKSTQAIHQGLKPYLDLFIDTKALLLCRLSACRQVPTLIVEVDRQALNPSNFHTRKAELSESFNSKRNKIAYLSDGCSEG